MLDIRSAFLGNDVPSPAAPRVSSLKPPFLVEQLNKTIQNLVFTMLKDDSEIAAKKSLDIMVVLYRKRVWVVRHEQRERAGVGGIGSI